MKTHTLEYARELALDHCPALYDEYFIKGFMMAVEANVVPEKGSDVDIDKEYVIDIRGSGTVPEILESLSTVMKAVSTADTGQMEDHSLMTDFFEK